jgi:tetratricopeptide (TPR) repeat protein
MKGVYVQRSHSYRLIGQFQKAIKDYDRAIELSPSHEWPYHYKGMTYRELGQYELAIQNWERYVELRLIQSASWIESEQAANAYTDIGLGYIELGQHQKAIEHFDTALAINQTYSGAISGKEKAAERLMADIEPQTRPLDATYTHNAAGFSIDYPSEWVITERTDQDAPEWILPDIDFKTFSGPYVKVEIGFSSDIHLEDFAYARILGDNTFRENSRIFIEAIPAYLSNGTRIPGGDPVAILMAVSNSYEVSIVFSSVADSEEFDKSTFAAIIASFKILEPSQ